MWLAIYKDHPRTKPKLIGRVHAIENRKPPDGAYPSERYEVKEWDGAPPSLGNAEQGILPDLDPTLADPDYADKVQQRLDFEALVGKATVEIAWLKATIPTIIDPVQRRIAQENLETIKAWRYVLRRLS